jgi:hypothetical protein
MRGFLFVYIVFIICYEHISRKVYEIIMCDRWVEEGVNGFLNFLEDMGDRPEGNYSIERIDVNGNYEPWWNSFPSVNLWLKLKKTRE